MYSFMGRVRIYHAINVNEFNFGLTLKEKHLLKRMLAKYTQKGGYRGNLRDIRCRQYNELIDNITKMQVIATREELELAAKLLIVKTINVEDIMDFEIKELKKFAGETGINAIAASKMKPEDLAREIVKKLDPKKGYSNEFVKWYDGLPDEFLASIEGKTTSSGDTPAEPPAELKDLIEAVEGCSKVSELKELLEAADLAPMFKGFDASKHKMAKPLKEAMLKFLNTPKESPKEKSPAVDLELVKAIQEAKTDDELIAVMESAGDTFAEFSPGDEEDLEKIKQLLFDFIGYKPEEEKKEAKPMSLKDKMAAKKAAEKAEEKAPESEAMVIDFNPKEFDAEAVYEQADKLPIGQLKKFYSQIKTICKIEMESNKPGITKESLMDNLANALQDLAENGPKDVECVCPPAAEGEVAITREAIEDAAKAEDKATLVAMCEQLEIPLGALEKRNINRMKSKLFEKVPESTGKPKRGRPAKAKEEATEAPPITKDSKLVEIFELVENGVLEGKAEKEILEEVSPLYKEMGRNALQIRSRVKTLIEVVQVEHDLKKKS